MEERVKKRFCTTCQFDRVEEGGEFRYFGKAKRWICRSCVAKTAERLAQRKERRVEV
jgi:hypothetical protein